IMKLSKITSYVMYAFLGLGALLVILYYLGMTSEGVIIGLAYIYFGIAAVASIVFPIIYLVANPKGAINVIIGLVFIGLVVLISYFLASGQVMHIPSYSGTDNVPGTLRTVGTGLYTMYILFFLAIIAILYSEITSVFK
ncbi:MAG: hypothetical protein J7L46_00605, partial [Bacteroidales bacterium]|nr:hypothetical protein [Bacteroidales bacterium]